jgi:hypothetical protein
VPDTSTTPLQYLPAVLVWAAAIYKLPAVRRAPGNLRLRALWLTLVVVASALTVLVPPIYVAFDQLAGVPNLARLVGNSLVLCGGFGGQAVMCLLDDDQAAALHRVRVRVLWLAGSLVLMTVFFVLAPLDAEVTTRFTVVYADAPFMLEYRLVFLAFLGVALIDVARLSSHYARQARRPLLRLGMGLNTAGGLFGLAFVVAFMAFLIADQAGYTFKQPEVVFRVLVFCMAGSLAVGSTVPAWGSRVGLDRALRWRRLHRAYRRLYILWAALAGAAPEIVLAPPASRLVDVVDPRNLDFRLYRRVVEIRDGYLALRPYRDREAAAAARELGAAAGLCGERLQAVVEAATLAAAIRRKADGRPARDVEADADSAGGADIDSEYVWLEQVARNFARSRIVHAVATRVA